MSLSELRLSEEVRKHKIILFLKEIITPQNKRYFSQFKEIPFCIFKEHYTDDEVAIKNSIIEFTPELNVNWEKASASKCVTPLFVWKNHTLPWDWVELSLNLFLSLDFILRRWYLPWDWKSVSSRRDVSLQIVESSSLNLWNWDVLSLNYSITMQEIEENLHLDWKPLYRRDISSKVLLFYLPQCPESEREYVFESASSSPNIDILEIAKHPLCAWNSLSLNPKIKLECLPTEKINWGLLARNPSFTLNDILLHPHKIEEYSYNPNLKFEEILSHPEIKWIPEGIVGNESLTIEEVLSIYPQEWITLKTGERRRLLSLIYALRLNFTEDFILRASTIGTYPFFTHGISKDFILSHPEIPWGFTTVKLSFSDIPKVLQRKDALAFLSSADFIQEEVTLPSRVFSGYSLPKYEREVLREAKLYLPPSFEKNRKR